VNFTLLGKDRFVSLKGDFQTKLFGDASSSHLTNQLYERKYKLTSLDALLANRSTQETSAEHILASNREGSKKWLSSPESMHLS